MSHPLQGDALEAARMLNRAAAKRKTADKELERLWRGLRRFELYAKSVMEALSPATVDRLEVVLVGGKLTSRFDRARIAA